MLLDGGIESFSYFQKIDEKFVSNVRARCFKCFRCSKTLFSDLNLINSNENKEISCLSLENLKDFPVPCSKGCPYHEKYYIEPMYWMLKDKFLLQQNQGNIHCPFCNFRIGEWNWSNFTKCVRTMCESGFAPRFMIKKQRVKLIET